jgi:hypothetical protein
MWLRYAALVSEISNTPLSSVSRFRDVLPSSCHPEGRNNMRDARRTWLYLVVGALIGLALGVLVSVTTDVPLAPEAGVVLGVLVGWLSRRVST